MSKSEPIWGIDVSTYQQSLDMKKVKSEGYEFVVAKATEGPYRDGTKYTDDRYQQHTKNAKAAGLIVGAYHFLVETPAKPQVGHFLEVVGDVRGKIIMVDFEAYNPPYAYLTPSNATLKAFIAELRRRIGGHPIVLYSGRGFWNGGEPTGPFNQYDADVAWDAMYLTMDPIPEPQEYYGKVKDSGWGKPWGDVEPMIWQFTPAGRVAGLNIDVNAFQGTRDELLALARSEAGEPSPTPTPTPTPTDKLPSWVAEPLIYLEGTKGGRYVVWESGRFADAAPAWVANTQPPPAKVVRDSGAFCAALPNLAMRKNGVPHVDMSNAWYGGVLWYGNYFVDQMDLAVRFDPHEDYPPGTLFIRRYTGPALSQQGHVAIMGRHGKLLQSDVPLGINEERTLPETQQFLAQIEGGGFQWAVLPENWLKPKAA